MTKNAFMMIRQGPYYFTFEITSKSEFLLILEFSDVLSNLLSQGKLANIVHVPEFYDFKTVEMLIENTIYENFLDNSIISIIKFSKYFLNNLVFVMLLINIHNQYFFVATMTNIYGFVTPRGLRLTFFSEIIQQINLFGSPNPGQKISNLEIKTWKLNAIFKTITA